VEAVNGGGWVGLNEIYNRHKKNISFSDNRA
jgi:hypothetical protein